MHINKRLEIIGEASFPDYLVLSHRKVLNIFNFDVAGMGNGEVVSRLKRYQVRVMIQVGVNYVTSLSDRNMAPYRINVRHNSLFILWNLYFDVTNHTDDSRGSSTAL